MDARKHVVPLAGASSANCFDMVKAEKSPTLPPPSPPLFRSLFHGDVWFQSSEWVEQLFTDRMEQHEQQRGEKKTKEQQPKKKGRSTRIIHYLGPQLTYRKVVTPVALGIAYNTYLRHFGQDPACFRLGKKFWASQWSLFLDMIHTHPAGIVRVRRGKKRCQNLDKRSKLSAVIKGRFITVGAYFGGKIWKVGRVWNSVGAERCQNAPTTPLMSPTPHQQFQTLWLVPLILTCSNINGDPDEGTLSHTVYFPWYFKRDSFFWLDYLSLGFHSSWTPRSSFNTSNSFCTPSLVSLFQIIIIDGSMFQ